MFRIVCDPSSGRMELYFTEIIRSGSQMFVVCLVGVWQRNFEPAECVHSTMGWELVLKHTKNICEPLRVISVNHSSVLPDDGSHTIRNMLE